MKRILIIDDQIDIQEILADFLRNRGFLTEAVSNGKAGLEKIREKNYHLIITDLMMPKGDGFTFIKNMQAILNETPVLIITGGGNIDTYDQQLKELVDQGYMILKKPFSKEALAKSIKHILSPPQRAV